MVNNNLLMLFFSLVICLFLSLSVLAKTGKQSAEHPYLYFSSEDVANLQERLKKEPFKTRWEEMLNNANEILDISPASHSRRVLGNCGISAFVYLMTGEEKYGRRAIEGALDAAGRDLDTWAEVYHYNRGANLVTAEYSMALGLVYDWANDLLTESEKEILRNAIKEKSFERYLISLEEGNYDWWVEHEVTNWRGVVHGGVGVAALAFYNDLEIAKEVADTVHEHIPRAIDDVVLKDGGGHEGVGYYNYGLIYATYFLTAGQRFYGGYEDTFQALADRLTGYWNLYMHGPDYRYANISRMGKNWNLGLWSEDGRNEGGPDSSLNALLDANIDGGDKLLRWNADNGGARFYWRGTSPFYFIWRRSVPSAQIVEKPDLQKAVLFRGTGHTIFQSDNLWLAYSGGHNKYSGDLGSFILVYEDTRMVHINADTNQSETDLTSTILVNGEGQQLGERAKYRKFGSGDKFHYLMSDISDAYHDSSGSFNNFWRQIIMVDGDYIVIVDEIKGKNELDIDWLLQTEHFIMTEKDENRASFHSSQVGSNHKKLDILFARPQEIEIEVEQRKKINVKSTVKDEDYTFITVIYPGKKEDDSPDVSFDNSGILEINSAEREDKLEFNREDQKWMLKAVNGETTDNIGSGDDRVLIPFRDSLETLPPEWLRLNK